MAKPLRIAYDAKRYYHNSTGLGNYSRSLIQNLYHYFPENEYQLFDSGTYTQANNNSPFGRIAIRPKPSSKSIRPFWRSYFIKNDLQKAGIQIYHGLSNEIPIGLKNIKTIVTIHDLIFKKLPHTYPLIDRWIYDFKFKYACKNADLIIAISESTKRDIIEYYNIEPSRIKVIYQSCNPIYYEENKENSSELIEHLQLPKDYLLSVGSLEERKNILIILKAIHLTPIAQRIPLLIIGKGKKYKKKLEEYIQKHQLSKWIIFLDTFVSLPELKAIYQAASIVIYPSLYEGFGLPVVEGLLCKTPVITSNISSLPEAGGLNTLYINPHDAGALKEAILKVLNDSDLRQQMINRGYDYAKNNFHPEVVTEQMLQVYKKI